MTTIGLDIGVTGGGVIVWAVFAASNLYAGMLAGKYVGATAEVSIAAGLGANVLVGGSNRTVALQPLSVQGQIGLDIAAGIGELELASGAIGSNPDLDRRACPPIAIRARKRAPLDQPRPQPETIGSYATRAPKTGQRREVVMAANANNRHASDRPSLCRAGRSVPERQDHVARSDSRPHRRDPAPGYVEAGNTVGDSSKEARHHRMSIELTVATTDFMGDAYTFLDCPGSVEFVHDMRAVLPAIDVAVVVCEMDEKKVPQLQLILRELEDRKIPRVLFLNKIDKADAGVHDVLKLLQRRFAHQAGLAPDPDILRRHHLRLRRSRARARLRLQGARRRPKWLRSRATRPIAKRRRVSPCWRRWPITTTS